MAKKAIFAVWVGGKDITSVMKNLVQSITINDRAGTSADSATIILDDSAGTLRFPRYNAQISILLGFKGYGISTAFTGTVVDVSSSGGRRGATLTIEASGLDTSGKMKEPQQRHFDNKSIAQMFKAAGDYAGVTDLRIAPELGDLIREYEHMDDESFIAFGQRMAKELGGIFKIRNTIALLTKKNAARAPSGVLLPPILASVGINLHSWRIQPVIGRPRYKQIKVKYYDTTTAEHGEVVVDTEIEGSDAVAVGMFDAPNETAAKEMAESLKTESARQAGVGSVTIEGNVAANPEARCILKGARQGVNGSYIIDGVEHRYSRASGFMTKLTLAYPILSVQLNYR